MRRSLIPNILSTPSFDLNPYYKKLSDQYAVQYLLINLCFYRLQLRSLNLQLFIVQIMRLVGKKFLKYTEQFREVHHTLRMERIKNIMKIEKSNLHFQKQFPQYPIQYSWNYKDIPLHVYGWEPKNIVSEANPKNKLNAKALLINFNALNAHNGLSGKMAQTMSNSGIIMTGFDYPNFGKSHSPSPGHIQSLPELVQISQHFLEHAINKYPGIPVYINGLSMGGLIAFHIGLKRPTLINGCILLNPAFKDNPVNNGFLKKIVMLGGMIFPKFQTMKPIRSHSTKHSLKLYKQHDKHMYSGKVWTSTTWALLSHMRKISKSERFSEFNLPFLCIQGGSDKILNPFTVFQLEKHSKSKDKEVVIVPDLWHALWFDDHHDQVVQMVKTWILDRVEKQNISQIQPNLSKQNRNASDKIQQAAEPHHGRHIHHHNHNMESTSKTIESKIQKN